MISKRNLLSILAVFVILAFNVSLALSSPVLIKLKLEARSDYERAQSLGVTAYQRFDNIFLAEIDSEKLKELRAYELEYEMVDGDPWSEEYFIVSTPPGVRKDLAPVYGKRVMEEPGLNVLKAGWDQALELQKMGSRVTHIPKRPIPLKYSPPVVLHKEEFEYSADLDSLVNLVSQDSLFAYVKRLQDFLSRFTWADSIVPAREWIYDKFVEFGCDSVYFDEFAFYDHSFEDAWTTQYNVVATVVGAVNPDKVVVVGGHYDSIVWNPMYLAYTQAPGADDNATGAVAAMEQARIIAKNPLPCTVVFVTFAGEELGLHGSWHHANQAASAEENILLMMNYDMIGHITNQFNVKLYQDDASYPYALIFKDMASLYNTPSLNVIFSGFSAGSDHLPFWQNGYSAFFAHEDVFSTEYHSPTDSIAYINFDYMERVVRAGLASLATVANHPGMVKGLDYVDAGDGENLYVNWLPNPENDLVSYLLYWGTHRGLYDSVRIVPSICASDTLYGLVSDSTYYVTVTAYNEQGHESLVRTEIAATPSLIPKAPEGFAANPAVREIKLTWYLNKEADLDHYDVFRSTTAEGDFELLVAEIESTSYGDTAVESGQWYFYYVTALDTGGLQSQASGIDSSTAITFDQGVLVIDETKNGNGTPGNPSDEQQDLFYAEIFEGFEFHAYDYPYVGAKPTLANLGPYSTVVWLDDDISHHSFGDRENVEMISDYLEFGGNFMWCSWGGLQRFGNLPTDFWEENFAYDYLHIQWAYWNQDYDFVGAKAAQLSQYPNVKVDTTRLMSTWEGKLRNIVKMDLHGEAEPIYLYDSFDDDTSFEDKICGLRYLGSGYKLIFLGFPIFYLEADDAKGLIQAAMRDLGEQATEVEEKDQMIVSANRFVLSQNYPNPFNSSTLITFKVNGSQVTENSPARTTVAIYNILGQKVKTLLDEERPPGNYRVTWDGKDDKGKEVASGIYLYRLKVGDFQQTRKMLLLK